MALIQFTLNGKLQSVNVNPEMPLLWVLRDTLGMSGTKFGCGRALCGACTVHINGAAFRSLSFAKTLSALKNAPVPHHDGEDWSSIEAPNATRHSDSLKGWSKRFCVLITTPHTIEIAG